MYSCSFCEIILLFKYPFSFLIIFYLMTFILLMLSHETRLFFNHVPTDGTAVIPFRTPFAIVPYSLTLGQSFDISLFEISRPSYHCFSTQVFDHIESLLLFYFRYIHTSLFHPHCSNRALGFTGFRYVKSGIFLYRQTILFVCLVAAHFVKLGSQFPANY